ncbi:MAG TPA: vitamin K epoxide reductase family protein [Candidatus Angelobacter sp.]|nr:vitamin K epoxide reductase family protein [Candidatus Angelobacter sp.]
MRWFIAAIALIGLLTSVAALREHYNTGASPCNINDKWDCGLVNHSPYAVYARVPVAAIGIAGYVLLGTLALMRFRRLLLLAALVGLGFSLYLTRIEAQVLQVWCLYCVISLASISLITLLALLAALRGRNKQTQAVSIPSP